MSTLNLEAAAARAHCHPDTVRKMMKAGEMPGTKIGRRWVVPKRILEAWLEKPVRKTAAISIERIRSAADRLGDSFPRSQLMHQTQMKLVLPSAAHSRKRKAAIRRATPPWVDRSKVRALQVLARNKTIETGELHSIDHIIPLHHPKICGLHVHENLRVIPARENSMKHNHWTSA